MMEKLAQAGEGGGVHARTLSLYLPSRTKLQCMLQLRGQIHSPYLISTPVYSVDQFLPGIVLPAPIQMKYMVWKFHA